MRKYLIALPLVALLAVSVPGCASFQGSAKDPSAAQQAAHVAFGFAKAALDYLKEEVTRHIDQLENPSPEQLDKMSEMVQRLDRAKVALELAEPYVMGEKVGKEADLKSYITDAAQSLQLVAFELEADGVKIPAVIKTGLELAVAYGKSA